MPFTVMETMLEYPLHQILIQIIFSERKCYLFDLKIIIFQLKKIIDEIQSDIENKKLYFEK